MAEICARFATPAAPDALSLPQELPPSVKAFFEQYSRLSFDGATAILDASVIRIVTFKKRQYLLIGRTADDGVLRAIDLQDRMGIHSLNLSEAGKVWRAEDEKCSFAHFVVLEFEAHLLSE